MLNGLWSVQYVKKCMHLGNELRPMNIHVLIDNVVNDINCRLSNLLADFAHGSSSTLSALFRTDCMNIYSSQIWPSSRNYTNKFDISRRKAIRRLRKMPHRTHNKYINIVNNCVDATPEKRCLKYLWKLINSKCKLYNSIVKYSSNNVSTTVNIIDQNMRYFMFKYIIQENYWYKSINIIYKKMDNYNVPTMLKQNFA